MARSTTIAHTGAKASSRPIWSGAISFGLVTIPVKLFVAVREKTLHFRSLHDQDHEPLKQKMVCPADGKEVHREHIVKGYEVEKDHFVVIRQEELEAVAPKATRAIEIQDFVELSQIDPLFFDKSYYVAPGPGGAKPYRLLFEAMAKTKKVGIAKVVMHNKEYLAALRPIDEPGRDNDALVLETMHFGDEVVLAHAVNEMHAGAEAKVDDRELKVAEKLIESLTTDFEPNRYHDEYREKVMEMIEKKAAGKSVSVRHEREEETPRNGHNLIAALEASIAQSKNGSGSNGNGRAGGGAASAGQAAAVGVVGGSPV